MKSLASVRKMLSPWSLSSLPSFVVSFCLSEQHFGRKDFKYDHSFSITCPLHVEGKDGCQQLSLLKSRSIGGKEAPPKPYGRDTPPNPGLSASISGTDGLLVRFRFPFSTLSVSLAFNGYRAYVDQKTCTYDQKFHTKFIFQTCFA